MACQFTENNLSHREKRNMTKQVTAVIPHLVVDDAAAALEFYKKALGAEEVMRLPAEDGKRLMHTAMKVGEARIFVRRSEEHTSELQSLMHISYAVFCLKKQIQKNQTEQNHYRK